MGGYFNACVVNSLNLDWIKVARYGTVVFAVLHEARNFLTSGTV
jgi:hypothetical protein